LKEPTKFKFELRLTPFFTKILATAAIIFLFGTQIQEEEEAYLASVATVGGEEGKEELAAGVGLLGSARSSAGVGVTRSRHHTMCREVDFPVSNLTYHTSVVKLIKNNYYTS
jgi:hypothetical protein